MLAKCLVVMLILAHVNQLVSSQFRPPSNAPGIFQPGPAKRRLDPVVQSGLFGGFGSLLLDNDQLQEKPCGRGSYGLATHSPSLRLWGFQSLAEPMFTCNCKIFTDNFHYNTIDNSPQARMECMTEYSGLYCCMQT